MTFTGKDCNKVTLLLASSSSSPPQPSVCHCIRGRERILQMTRPNQLQMGANLIDIWAAVTKKAAFQVNHFLSVGSSLLVPVSRFSTLPPPPALLFLRPPPTDSPDSNCVCPSSQCNFPITATRAAAQLIPTEVVS